MAEERESLRTSKLSRIDVLTFICGVYKTVRFIKPLISIPSR